MNFSDLVLLSQHYNTTGTTWDTGDFTGDGSTNFADLVSLSQNYTLSLSAKTQTSAKQAATQFSKAMKKVTL